MLLIFARAPPAIRMGCHSWGISLRMYRPGVPLIAASPQPCKVLELDLGSFALGMASAISWPLCVKVDVV